MSIPVNSPPLFLKQPVTHNQGTLLGDQDQFSIQTELLVEEEPQAVLAARSRILVKFLTSNLIFFLFNYSSIATQEFDHICAQKDPP